MSLVKTACKTILVVVTAIVIICSVRTFVLVNMPRKTLPQCSVSEGDEFIDLTDERWQLLKDSLRIRTISRENGLSEFSELERMRDFVIKAHPTVFKSEFVEYEIVNGYSLLIHAKGSDSKLTPYLLAAHMDVVPVIESLWSVDPFNATEDETGTKVYARGAIDNKGNLMAHLAAFEFMLKRGKRPNRSFYLAYGHDEELMGYHGAAEIAKALRAKGVNRLHFVLDEGMFVTRKVIGGVESNVAVVGVTEKGYINVNMSVEIPGGHSSTPPKETAISVLSGAVARLQSNPMPGQLDDIATEMLLSLVRHSKFPLNVLLSNLWLFRPIVTWVLGNNRDIQGTIRTTTAVTVLRSGTKNNVIPSSAWAIINHRLHHMDTLDKVLEYDRKIVNDDRVKLAAFEYLPSHPISPYDRTSDLSYQVVTDTIEQIFGSIPMAPGTLIASTDTKHYLEFTENVFRFSPFILEPRDIATIHAEDEAITRDNFQNMINFYYHIMQNADRTELRTLTENKGEL